MTEKNLDEIIGKITLIAEVLKKESQTLIELVDYTYDAENVCKKLAAFEAEADSISHDISQYYRSNKIGTNMVAMGLFELAEAVEDATDCENELALDFLRYNVTQMREEYICLFEAIVKSSHKVCDLIIEIRKQESRRAMLKEIIDLDHYKDDFDMLYSVNMNKLFSEEKDPIEIIKWKEINNSFRSLFRSFEVIAETCGRYIVLRE